jgi:SAM-dependent MidA family methyltransferase
MTTELKLIEPEDDSLNYTKDDLDERRDAEVEDRFSEKYFPVGIPIDLRNPLTRDIAKEIGESPDKMIPYSRFVDISLFDPKHGYYSSGKVAIGSAIGPGHEHFNTSPETSRRFGGSYSLVLFETWQKMGKPERFDVVEMGAGNGSLANGILDWAEKIDPAFYQALQYKIIEYSGGLALQQQKNLLPYKDKVSWILGSAYELDHEEIEGGFVFNELMDAFPPERLVKIDGKILQKYVTIENGGWVEKLAEPTSEVRSYLLELEKIGASLELEEGVEEPIFLGALELQKKINKALKRGVIINTDYGTDGNVGRAYDFSIRSFGNQDFLEHIKKDYSIESILPAYVLPGDLDITADVNFHPLLKQAENDGLKIAFNGLQKDFILGSGMNARLIAEIEDIISRKEKGLNDLNDLREEANAYWRTVSQFGTGHFHTVVLTKDVDIKLHTPSPRELENYQFWFPFRFDIYVPDAVCKAVLRVDSMTMGLTI